MACFSFSFNTEKKKYLPHPLHSIHSKYRQSDVYIYQCDLGACSLSMFQECESLLKSVEKVVLSMVSVFYSLPKSQGKI